MERVATLIQKLKEQAEQNAPVEQMLQTLQMLQFELVSSKTPQTSISENKIGIIMPSSFVIINPAQNGSESSEKNPQPPEEKIIEVLQVDEKEIEEELEEIKRNAEAKNQMSAHAKPQMLFDPMEDVPTLTHQTPANVKPEINDMVSANKESLNEKLNHNNTEVSHKLTEEPVKDLRKAIGVNDRFLYINELFRGDEAMYERSIKTINNFSIFAEAEFWIRRELKLKIGWNDNDPVVKQFDQLVRRRFS